MSAESIVYVHKYACAEAVYRPFKSVRVILLKAAFHIKMCKFTQKHIWN